MAASKPRPRANKPAPAQPQAADGLEDCSVACTAQGDEIRYEKIPFNSGSEGRLYKIPGSGSLLKLYTTPETWRKSALEAIIVKRAQILGDDPDYWERFFCWPQKVIVQPSLGLIMPQARAEYRPFSHFLLPRFRQRVIQQQGAAAVGSWIGHVGILMKLARAVHRLHRFQVCHSDLSLSNILVDPVRGAVSLIDCDSIVEQGSSILLPTVLGTPDFMAPELVAALGPRKKGPAPQPSVYTDLHAFEVIIYYGLLYRHPLKGGAFHSADSDEDERLTLGAKALYIEHPTQTANRPNTPFLSAAILGPQAQDLFLRAFTDGLRTPERRPSALEWEDALTRMYDQTVPCANPQCDAKAFVFTEYNAGTCPWCGETIKTPNVAPMFGFYSQQEKRKNSYQLDFHMVGWPQRTLRAWHIVPGCLPGPRAPENIYGSLHWQKGDSSTMAWFLKNESIEDLRDITDSRNILQIEPGRMVILREGSQFLIRTQGQERLIKVFMAKTHA